MNNEEKILEMLTALTGKVDKHGAQLDGMEERLGGLEGRLDGMEEQLNKHGAQLDRLEGRLDRMEERLDGLEGRLDGLEGRLDRHGAQLDRVEDRLDNLTERVDEIDNRSLRVAVLLETEVARDIRLVYEGQEMLRQKLDELAPKERVEVLEDEVIALKTTVKLMAKRLEALEKAQ